MSDSAQVIGTTAPLHAGTKDIRVIHKVTTKKGVHHFSLADAEALKVYSESRASVVIVGPIRLSYVGPSSADIVISASATIVPSRSTHWPSDLTQLAEDAGTVNFAISALSPAPLTSVPIPDYINRTLLPVPFLDEHPEIVLGWEIETDKTVFGRFEITIPIAFDGLRWVKPASWKK